MRNRGIVGLVLILVVAFSVTVGAIGVAQAAPAGQVALSLDGKPLTTAGRLVDGTTVVSLKDIATDLGLSYCGPGGGEADVTYKDKHVTFTIGGTWADVNGHEVLCPWTVAQEGNQVLVPLRFLLENMGFAVKWTGGATMRVDLRPITENPIIIGTVRERQETATLGIDLQYPRIVGLDASVQGQLNTFFANRTSTAVKQAYQSEKDNIAAGFTQWPSQVFCNYTVTYNQQNLLSMYFDDYLYAGGAHGSTLRTGYTVDIKTGTSYALKDLFVPGTDYVSLISAEITKQIAAQELMTLEPFTKIRDNQDYYISGDNLVVYFQQYELMPYAWGFPEFRIPMASLKNVLVPEMAARVWAPAK